jgi:hypothetical protein
MSLRVFDETGAEATHNPIEARLRTDDEAAVKGATHVDFSGQLSLNRVGNYTLRIAVTDRNADKTTHFEAPLRVTAP